MSAALDPPQSLWRRVRTSPAWAATTAIGSMLLLTLLAWGGWRTYDSTRQRVLVLSGEEPVGLELYAAGDRTVPLLSRDLTQETRVRLPRGEYDLRIIGRGRVGDVLTIDLDEDVQSVSTSLDHLRYVEPFEESAHLIPLDLGGQALFLAIGAEGLRLIAGSVTSQEQYVRQEFGSHATSLPARWTLDLRDPAAHGLPPGFDWTRTWEWARAATTQSDLTTSLPRTAARAADLDGDDVPDIVFSATCQAWIAAISGATGEILWFAGRGADVLARVTRPADEAASTVLGCPEVVDDLDGDGVDDVLATFFDRHLESAEEPESWTEAISGATGDVVWKFSIPSPDFAGSDVSALASHSFALKTDRRRDFLGGKRVEFLVPSPEAARSIAWGGARVAAIVVPEQVLIVDLATGESIGARWQVPAAIQRVRQWRDLDHDGYDDLVGWMKTADSSPGIVAYSVRHQRRLWTWDASPFVTSPQELLEIESLLADLDGDGVDDVLALGTTAQDRHELLVALDGRTGCEQWRKRLPTSRKFTGTGRLLIGPDIDGDRRREIYLVSVFDRGGSSRVQAISGANGADLWRAVASNGVVNDAVGAPASWYVRPAEVVQTGWWQAGADGWPQLLVRWKCRDERLRSSTRCFSAGTGAVTHSGRDIDQSLTRDLDGDGVEELLTLRKADDQDERGTWEVTHGSAATRWRRTSVELATIADINADGCADLLDVTDPQRLRVRDGRTGRLAWESSFSDQEDEFFERDGVWCHGRFKYEVHNIVRASSTAPAPGTGESTGAEGETGERKIRPSPTRSARLADLDDDGVPDLLRSAAFGDRRVTWLVSGRTGRAQRLRQSNGFGEVLAEWAADLNGDSRPEWVVLERTLAETHLVAWSRDCRRRLWSRTSSHSTEPELVEPDHPLAFDCDGDGIVDFVFAEVDQTTGRTSWTAVAGRDGATLWKVDVRVETGASVTPHVGRLALAAPTFGDSREPTLLLFASVRPHDAYRAPESSPYLLLEALDAKRGVSTRQWRLPDAHAAESAWLVRHDHAYQAVAVTGPFGDSYFLADAQGKVTVRERTDDDSLPWGSNARIAVPGVDSTTGRMLGRTSTRTPLAIHQARNRAWELYSGSLDLDSAEVLELVANHRPPHWVFRDGSTTYVRQAALTPTPEERLPELANFSVAKNGDSRILGDGWLGWGADRVSPPPRPGPDLRLARQLPWMSFPTGEEFDEFWVAPSSLHPIRYVRPIVQRVWLACVWVIGPLAVLSCVLRRRRFSLRLLLVAPVLVGAMLMIGSGATGSFERDRWFDWNFSAVRRWADLPGQVPQVLRNPTRWELAAQYAPPVAAVGWWLAALARRRWREGAVGLVVLLLGTTCVGATLVALDAHTTPLAADEFYAWGGLPLVLWPGLLATSWCLVPLVPACGAVKWLLRRRQPKPAVSA